MPGVRRAGRQGGRSVRLPARQSRIRPFWLRRTTSSGGSRNSSCARPAGRNGSPRCARRCRRPWSRVPASIVTPSALQQAEGKLQQLQERFRDVALEDHSYTFNTELTAALELSYMLDLAQVIVASALQSAGVARIASAHRPSGAGRPAVSCAFAGRPGRATARRGSSTCR